MGMANIQSPPEKKDSLQSQIRKHLSPLEFSRALEKTTGPRMKVLAPTKVFCPGRAGWGGVALNVELETISLVNIRHFPDV